MTDSRLVINYPRLRRGVVDWVMLATDLEENRVLWGGYDTHRPVKRPYIGVKTTGPRVRVPATAYRPKPCALSLRYTINPDLDIGERVVIAVNKVNMSAIVPAEGPLGARTDLLTRMNLSLDRWVAIADPDDSLSILVNERTPGGIWAHEAKYGATVEALSTMMFSTVICYPILRVIFTGYSKEPGDELELLEDIALAVPSRKVVSALSFHGVRIVGESRDTTDRSAKSGGGTEARSTVDFTIAVTSRRVEPAESPVQSYSQSDPYDEP